MTSIPIDTPDTPADTSAETAAVPATRVRTRAGALTPVSDPAVPARYRTAVAELVQPPDIWSDPRPSLRSLWLYARYGGWTGERTPTRVAGTLYTAFIALPTTAIGYLALWLVERPARLAVAVLTIVLAVLAI